LRIRIDGESRRDGRGSRALRTGGGKIKVLHDVTIFRGTERLRVKQISDVTTFPGAKGSGFP
jgi:hypothetical protein